ncbi:MAG: hypothetical protein A3A28_05615 [Candidatus Sungbacteria bacterium RIFCSPLOWO2_01_FULL_47_32]|uniref:Photosynthesis system II assembly factor Ycf48/Hcf136-like domain-containing protein n=1 Tax=Candidatus Sungbacteria bacterium RIFCSPHIGHO2_01_FULL_47_32 TaxID=1802264 RepID=A0A1G2K7I3_9BACT|nr:MAG: Glycosyl hydrolase [Parcubacteria group bacterium GW2011_GWA2_47_10]OGZ94440.1 MAG: hypothetical protein A2633_04150 [Candidatus Sungbacteria bacterium RIFCSPHIGHO2_01_FULL_47_32]OGZ98032.1 MAG: hypothetical protein A3D57_02855 [Candidatus Sungbacteria bacterium RIFCSPHIGHO2_02_FULL_46_12]OHA05782.1 MAG: hypothetical protein A3A28_05615 [Candidatus Sungbacteria bacterium RIFCSPLOWO2_01_FULL_47_32]
MKTLLIVIISLAVLGIVFVIVLPFMLGYTPQTPQKASEAPEAKEVGIFRSQDKGGTWQRIVESENIVPINAYPILDMTFHPRGSDIIFAGTKGGGLWRNVSKSNTWDKIQDKNNVLDASSQIYKIAVDKSNPQDIYLAAYQGDRGRVLKSTDGGGSFQEIYFTPVEKFGVFDLYVGGGAVYMITGQGGFFISRDHGKSWRVVRWFLDGLIKLVVDPNNQSVMYILTPKGSIFRTTDSGESWLDISNYLSKYAGARLNQNLFIDQNSRLYLASNYGLITSKNQGKSWEEVPLIIPPQVLPVLSVAVSPDNASEIYVSASNELYKTEDGGKSWSVAASPSGKKLTMIKVDPQSTNTIYAVVTK